MVAPCTTTVRGLDTEVALDPDVDPVDRFCVANLDSVETIPVSALVERLGRLGLDRLLEICDALEIAVDCRR
jgi:mRNA interferase MazF